MPVATLRIDSGKTRSFYVDICPIHVMYQGKLWARQPGGEWEKDSTYRETGALVLDDTMRVDRQQQQETAA